MPALKFVCVVMCMSLVAAINKLSVGFCAPAVPSSLTRAINALTIALLNTLVWPAALMDENECCGLSQDRCVISEPLLIVSVSDWAVENGLGMFIRRLFVIWPL